MKERAKELNILHQAYTIKERIMGGEYQLANISYAPLAELICEYLGFEKQLEKVPTMK